MNYRVGNGFDVHKFDETRDLYLGGIKIENHPGLAGHSDADVLIHAIIDSLLGASGLGDIGEFFPDSDEKYRGISSVILLEEVMKKFYEELWQIENIDAVVICETPKLLKYRELIRANLAGIMKIRTDQIMVKGKTSEKLGFTGRGEGIAVTVTTLCRREK